MSQALNNEFRNDPFGFAQRNVLWPGDAEGMFGLQAGVSTGFMSAKAPIASGESLFHLKGDKRIWSCDLSRVGTRVMLNKSPGAVVAPAMAIYYLPWAEDQVLRTTLRSNRNQALRGAKTAIVANAANALAVPAQNTNDPDIFFTAGVNGCMVVVEGPQDEPSVYHCNAKTTAGSPLKSAVDDQDELAAQGKIDAKVLDMTTRMSAMSTASPKVARGAGAALTRKATNQNDYQLLAIDGQAGAGASQTDWDTIRGNIATVEGITKRADKRIRVSKSVGTIFGARSPAGLWTFYYQKLVCYEIWKQHGLARKWRKEPGDSWFVAHCREFWPNGGGHIV